MIISMPDNWDDARDKHVAFLTRRIDKYLKAQRRTLSPQTAPFVKAIRNQVISGTYADLVATVPTYEKVICELKTDRRRKRFVRDIQTLFNYSAFCNKALSGWNAYTLCAAARYSTCPYCNQAYTFTIIGDEGCMRPTLDHFLSKERYPHLALSLNNLVPSCYHCNSNLKGSKDFRLNEHLHPLFDAENILFSVDQNGDDIVEFVSNFAATKKSLQVIAEVGHKCTKTSNSLRTFLINQRYAAVSKEAAHFIDQVLWLGECRERFRDLDIFDNEQRILGFERVRYRSFLLGKMYADLYDKFSR